jgi:hypothetical protein
MNSSDVVAGAAALALIAGIGTTAPAQAEYGIELNGTYQVMSDGQWATRGAAPGGGTVYIDQKSTTETWTVRTSCASAIECSGTVESSLGWTGTIRLDDYWYVDHEVPNWLPCPDGTSVSGHQKFILMGFDPARNERRSKITDFLMGRNHTKAPSGACGRNQPLVIEMPVKAVKLS